MPNKNIENNSGNSVPGVRKETREKQNKRKAKNKRVEKNLSKITREEEEEIWKKVQERKEIEEANKHIRKTTKDPLIKGMDSYMRVKLAALVEMLADWVHPGKRGMLGTGSDVQIQVEDQKMDSFLKYMRKRNKGGQWEANRGHKTIKSLHSERTVKILKLETTSKKDVESFLSSFVSFDKRDFFDQHFLSLTDVEDPELIWMDPKKREDDSDIEIEFQKDEIKKEKGWSLLMSTKFSSTKLLLGKFKYPGTLTSKSVQKENGTNLKKYGTAKFSIEYRQNVFPKSGLGILVINCKYLCCTNGWRYGN